MTKSEFLTQLRERLQGLPEGEAAERVTFYREMIEDRMDDGMPEEEAVAAAGSLDAIVDEILKDKPLGKMVIEKVRPKRSLRAWEIVLLVLGSPVWLPLLIAALAVAFSVTVAFFSVLIAAFAVVAACAAAGLFGLGEGILLLCRGEFASGLCMLGAGIASIGIFILLGIACVALTKLFFRGIRAIVRKIKRRVAGKERKS